MSQPEHGPNLERRSSAPLFCLCGGLALLAVAWLLGIGGALSVALSGEVVGAARAMGAGLAALGCFILGLALTLIGGIWLVIQVIADQTGKDKYSKVER